MTPGAYIRKAREERGYSLNAVAKEIGISAPFLSDIERGNRRPGTDVLDALCERLNIDKLLLFHAFGKATPYEKAMALRALERGQ